MMTPVNCPAEVTCADSNSQESVVFVFKRGDTWCWRFEVEDELGKPYDLFGCSAWIQIRDAKRTLVADSKFATMTMTGNVIDVCFDPTQTAIKPGLYRMDLQLTYANGSVGSTKTLYVRVLQDETYAD